MAIPSTLNADMLKEMAKALEDFRPRKSLMMSAGFRREAAARLPVVKPETSTNPLLSDYTITQQFMGIPIEPFDIPPEEVIDWSGCRSPSRAKRRHARGIPQRIKIEYRERAYLINRDALARLGAGLVRDLDARLFASIYVR